MDDETVRCIEMRCTYVSPDGNSQCPVRARVNVAVVDDEKLQKKIDDKANIKLMDALLLAHREGEHDGR